MSIEEVKGDIKLILENQAYQREKLRKIDHIITGNGDPSKGMLIRLDRMEQAFLENKEDAKDRKRQYRRILGAAAIGFMGFCGSVTLLVLRIVWGV